MDRNERARIVRAPLRADPPPARRAARAPRWKSSALPRAEVSRLMPLEKQPSRWLSAAGARRRTLLCFRVPFSAGGRRSIRPAGARAGRARVRRDAGCSVGEPRPTFTHLPRSGRRRCRGVLLFGFFLLDKQEKETGPQGCGTNLHGRGPVVARCGTNTHGRWSSFAKQTSAIHFKKDNPRNPTHVPRGFARCVGFALHGSSGHGCLG